MNGSSTSSSAPQSVPSQAEQIAKAAKDAFDAAQLLENGVQERITALRLIKDTLAAAKDDILHANALDMEAARDLVKQGKLSSSLVKRLDLQSSPTKFDEMLQGVQDVANLDDPAGKTTYAKALDDGLNLYRVTCPIGVLLVIFEARPEVIVNITSLAIKSGNAAILKGGKESFHTQHIMTRLIQAALSRTAIPRAYIQTVATRQEISDLLDQDRYIDLVIPRGSNALVKSIQDSTKIPVMGHADGICMAYVDAQADVTKATRVVTDSKISYPAACNALETLLLHQDTLAVTWPAIAQGLLEAGVTLHCDPTSLSAISSLANDPNFSGRIVQAIKEDYDTEFLSLDLAVMVVPDMRSAISHINEHSSKHTNVIITENEAAGRQFCRAIDAAGVYVNASTRFADGFRYGFGTEVGIATGKTHARGPVGLEGLMIYKYILKSEDPTGHVSLDFGGAAGKQYLHAQLPLQDGIL